MPMAVDRFIRDNGRRFVRLPKARDERRERPAPEWEVLEIPVSERTAKDR